MFNRPYNDEERKSYLKILPLRAKEEEYKGVGRPQICVFEGLEDTLKKSRVNVSCRKQSNIRIGGKYE